MHEKRSAPRLRGLLKGRIMFNGGLMSVDCVIRDFSLTGARLELSESVTLPDRFDLDLPHRERATKAYIKWRRGNQLGVAFDPVENAPPAPPEPQDVAARVRQLKAEIGAMRLLVAQMQSELHDLTKTGAGTPPSAAA